MVVVGGLAPVGPLPQSVEASADLHHTDGIWWQSHERATGPRSDDRTSFRIEHPHAPVPNVLNLGRWSPSNGTVKHGTCWCLVTKP